MLLIMLFISVLIFQVQIQDSLPRSNFYLLQSCQCSFTQEFLETTCLPLIEIAPTQNLKITVQSIQTYLYKQMKNILICNSYQKEVKWQRKDQNYVLPYLCQHVYQFPQFINFSGKKKIHYLPLMCIEQLLADCQKKKSVFF